MVSDLEKAQILYKLARKDNWGNCYDRLEHFKRFPELEKAIKELAKTGWVIVHPKGKFTGISVNTKHKAEIVEFISKILPHLEGDIK